MNKADVSIIGGTGMDRVVLACKLRGMGFSAFTALENRKRSRMFKQACDENKWGRGGVYDIDDPEDLEWLQREDLQDVGV